MAIDLDAIRKKLSQLSGNNSKRNTMWRPQEGEAVVAEQQVVEQQRRARRVGRAAEPQF